MNIILQDFRTNLKSLIIWIVCFGALFAIASTEFSTFQGSSDVDEMIAKLPEAFIKALSLDAIRFDRVEGFYSYVAQYVMIASSIYAGLMGAGILSKEIVRKTAETSLALPVSRNYFIGMKTIVAITNCLLLTAASYVLSMVIFGRFDSSPAFGSRVLGYCGIICLIQLLFVFAGLAISVLTQRHKRTGTIVTAIAVAAFMCSFIANIGDDLEFLRYFTPFEYFTAIDVIHGNNIELFGFIVIPVLIIVCGITSFSLVQKKDIYI